MSQIVEHTITNALLDRAGKKGGFNKKKAVQLHIQDGYGKLTSFFNGAQADSTMQIMRNGTIYRLLYDDDVTWTNGDWTPPFDYSRAFVKQYANTEYSGNLMLTVELEGKPGDVMPEAQYLAMLWLCQYWCNLYHIPMTRDWIIRHSSCGEHKYCPGPYVNDDKLFKDLADGITSMDNNPNKYDIGTGFQQELAKRGHVSLTNEQFYSPDAGQTLEKRSFMWAKDPTTGKTYIYLYFAGEGVVRVVEEI